MHLTNKPTLNLLGKVFEKPLPSTLLMLIIKHMPLKWSSCFCKRNVSNFQLSSWEYFGIDQASKKKKKHNF